MPQIIRQTFFTLPKEEDQEVALAAYKEMIGTNKKVKSILLCFHQHSDQDADLKIGWTDIYR